MGNHGSFEFNTCEKKNCIIFASIITFNFEFLGIYPLNPDCLPDYAYTQPETEHNLPKDNKGQQRSDDEVIKQHEAEQDDPLPLASKLCNAEKITPGKMLNILSPLPNAVANIKTRGKNVAQILTSPENLEKRQQLDVKKQKKGS